MKYWFLTSLLISSLLFSQENKETSEIEVSFLHGNVMAHSEDLHHLVTGHPDGFLISWSRKTFGAKEWQQAYNFPDYGTYFMFQDYKNEFIGKSYSVGFHYNFYFFKRHLQFKLAQGISLVSDPYDRVTNSKNRAFGTRIQANINLGLNYKRDYLFDNFGVNAGLLFTHNSNGRTKSPNSGINTYLLQVGLNYNFDEIKERQRDTVPSVQTYKEPLRYIMVFRTGINESSIIRNGQEPFYHLSFYVDKRVGRKSAFQVGTELFLTNSFKNFIDYRAVAFPEKNVDPNTDYKRVGIMIGHELFINKLSIETQIGYYVYQPFDHDIAIYDRLGLKYYFTKNIFANAALKTHLFKAEALEFGFGVRL